MASEKDVCQCGHERLYHKGNARNLLDRKGCGVTYCHCSEFDLLRFVEGRA
jgi:hypothetical protein